MTCIHISFMGPLYSETDSKGRRHYWYWHDYLGPSPATAKGEDLKRFPGEKARFWEAFNKWTPPESKSRVETSASQVAFLDQEDHKV